MKIIYNLFLFFVLLIHQDSWANPFKNYKESESYYIGKQTRKKLQKFLYNIDEVSLLNSLNEVFNDISSAKQACSINILNQIKIKVETLDGVNFYNDKISLLTFGRESNIFDDLVYKSLLKNYPIYISLENNLDYINDHYKNYKITNDKSKNKLIQSWRENLKNKSCIIDSSLELFHALSANIKWKKKNKNIKKKLKSLLKDADINYREYEILETLRKNDLVDTWKTLGQYYKLVNKINKIYPFANQSSSEFVTKRSSWKKWSLRENLLQNYDIIQIGYLSDVIKRLKMRMNIENVNISLSNGKGEIKEVILLTPMEQYRFSIKMIRKEMAGLKMLPRFAGKSPRYGDLITAAFETGAIVSREIEFITNLEFFWNPKMTKKEKVLKYIRVYGGIASVVIPPPYNAIFPIFLTLLEYFTYEVKPDGSADVINLF